MNRLISDYLKNTISLSERELALLEDKLEFKVLEKDDYLLRKGEVCSFFGFIESGAIYQYKIDTDLEQNIIDLNVSKDWVLNHKSFTSQKPSDYYIQAFEKSYIHILSIESIHTLIAESQSFLQMGKILENAVARVDFFDNNNSPDEKYLHVLHNKPEIIQKFPQKIIASYLKVSPETLSRVRKRIL